MIKDSVNFHGSDLELIEAKYHIRKEEIINYSGNVNPLGISSNLKKNLVNHIDLITQYPDRQYTTLRQALSEYVHAPIEQILVGNGSTELISLSIQTIAPKKALILGPTYSEYEKEIKLRNGSVFYYRLKEELDFELELQDFLKSLTKDLDLLVLCNPNNPTSSVIPKKNLRVILDHCKQQGIVVIIDETYVEFCEDIDSVTAISLATYYDNLIILRGFSKFFASPGLRLGYCICGNEQLISELNTLKNPWSINALASYAGEILLKDTDYIEQSKALTITQRNMIYDELKKFDNLKVYYPHANFILCKITSDQITSKALFEELISHKMMIRDASSFPFLNAQFFRFSFHLPENNKNIIHFLRQNLEQF